MEQDIQAQVLKVEGRNVKGNKTIYDVSLSDGQKYTTFDQPLATRANALVGQMATARVKVEQKGPYTNYYLNDIAAAGGMAPLPAPAGTPLPDLTPPVPAAAAAPIPIAVVASSDDFQRRMFPDVEVRITKLSAIQTAYTFVGQLYAGAGPESFDQAHEQALGLAKELFSAAYGGQVPVVEGQIVATASTPAEVAAQVNEAAGTPVVRQGIEW